MARGGGRGARHQQKERAQAREALEREYADTLMSRPKMAPLVIAKKAKEEPFHRWRPYRQGFSPQLVRQYLADPKLPVGFVLDPFAGSGTTAIECAREGRQALAVDSVASLSLVTQATVDPPSRDFAATLSDDVSWDALWNHCASRFERAAVLAALSLQYDGEGHKKSNPESPVVALRGRLEVMTEDALDPIPAHLLHTMRGDTRNLPLSPETCAGILTSPPYLSRYDYARVNDPCERLLTGGGKRKGRRRQLAAAKATAKSLPEAVALDRELHPAAAEAAAQLENNGYAREALAVRNYFRDFEQVLAEWARVLKPKGLVWMVVAGAEFRKEPIPADLILAERAVEHGFKLEALWIARRLKSKGRRLGTLGNVAPRETVIVLTKR